MRRSTISQSTVILLMMCTAGTAVNAEVVLPGKVNSICYYSKFFYNLPQSDFIYYLNDRLLYSEPPDEELFDSGQRRNLWLITLVHKRLKRFIEKNGRAREQDITIHLGTQKADQKAEELFALLGLEFRKNQSQEYQIMIDASEGIVDYHAFASLDFSRVQRQLNKSRLVYFKLRESRVPIPWDLEFLHDITGLELNEENFFETMLKDERFSLLLGVLFRLSDEEIDFISGLDPEGFAWAAIYRDKLFLTGLFAFANACRVVEGQLSMPGGEGAISFWSSLAGADYHAEPFRFLRNLVCRDEGKLNYIFLFTYFLPVEKQKIFLADFNPERFLELYHAITPGKKAVLQISRLPRIRNHSFFTLIYALQQKDGKLVFPAGIDAWIQTVHRIPGADIETLKVPEDISYREKEWRFIRQLTALGDKSHKHHHPMRTFLAVYTKFLNRSELLDVSILGRLLSQYPDHNVIVDYIERIPISKKDTVSAMMDWVQAFQQVEPKERIILAKVTQSLLELIAFQGRMNGSRIDFDNRVRGVCNIPLSRRNLFDRVFAFLADRLDIPMKPSSIDRSILRTTLTRMPNQYIQMSGTTYRFMVQDMMSEILSDIIESQEVSALSSLLTMKELLDRIIKTGGGSANLGEQLRGASLMLRHPAISDDAPGYIKERVRNYERDAFEKDISTLVEDLSRAPGSEPLAAAVQGIKDDYLIYQLSEYLTALSYSLNAKNADLRIFLNPNLIRLHDFSTDNSGSPWNSCEVAPSRRRFRGFHLKGGLSRLNIPLATTWKDHLFSRNIIYDSHQTQAILINLLDMFPVAPIKHSPAFVALVTEFGLELVQKALDDQRLKASILREIGTITSGFHYRKIMDYLTGIHNDYYLFFNELFALGYRFLQKDESVTGFSAYDALGMLYSTHLFEKIKRELNEFGGIYYHTFGNLRPRWMRLFPQEIAALLESDWMGGALNNEFKIKTAYHAYKRKMPPQLFGQFLYRYLTTIVRRYLAQNYIKDYYSTYFIFDIMNNAHINKIIKKLQKAGLVRLQ